MTDRSRAPRSYNPIDASAGLHQLLSSVNQLSFMRQHSEQLLEMLDDKLARTYNAAPVRKASYKLKRNSQPNPHHRERLLEKAIWRQWRPERVTTHDGSFYSLCRHIQTYQMPLRNRQEDSSWGMIDLVGISNSGLPIVLELKQEDARDTPLRMLVEGLAYAVALRKAWDSGRLKTEWAQIVTKQSKQCQCDDTLAEVRVIGIAPSDYWAEKIGAPGKKSNGKVPDDAWTPFHELCKACCERGYPVEFLQFQAVDIDDRDLPRITSVQKVSLPSQP